MSDPFVIINSSAPEVPIILSVPHCGTSFPSELEAQFVTSKMQAPDDTDWYVHELYQFVEELGITMIHAKYSRWVIDLNRDPASKPLYNDGRIITALTPHTDFFGDAIYKNEQFLPDETEVERRLATYYWPYYQKIEAMIQDKLERFGKVLLWDAHSIRRFVPTINANPFPDMILGDNDGKTAHASLIETTLNTLKDDVFEISHNTPFKGGNITRSFGRPDENIHALQLEMNKVLYMDDSETKYHEYRANQVQLLLRQTFEKLILTLNEL